jgi:hypothetical protein
LLEVVPGVVYVNKFDFGAQSMSYATVRSTVKVFLQLIYQINALKLCVLKGVVSKKKGEPRPPILCPEGVEAVHGEFENIIQPIFCGIHMH